MTADEIRRILAQQPFVPFRVLVADGQQYDVDHPEGFAFGDKGRLIAIGLPDSFVTLDLLPVTGIEPPTPRVKRGRNGRAKRSA